jgi:hypothetical protein
MGRFYRPIFYAGLNVRLPGKATRQALPSGHRGQPFSPLRAPVDGVVRGFCLTGDTACVVALIFSRLFVGIGVAAAAAFHAIEFASGSEVFAFMATGQMPVDVEMDNHELSPSLRVQSYDN